MSLSSLLPSPLPSTPTSLLASNRLTLVGFLVLLACGIPLDVLARSTGHVVDKFPSLQISSNLEEGRIYLGDVVGPLVINKSLAITCSTRDPEIISLSWWEGGEQLLSADSSTNTTISRTLDVGTLRVKDSGRHFTCRDLASGTEKSVDLHLVDDIMDIQIGGRALTDGETVNVSAGQNSNLSCCVNGSNPTTGTWWDGKKKLKANRSKSNTVVCNQLVRGLARIEDNGRNLTCRAWNGQLTKTVVLQVLNGTRSQVARSRRDDVELTPEAPAPAVPSLSMTTSTLLNTVFDAKTYILVGVTVMIGIAAILILAVVYIGHLIIKQNKSNSQPQANSPNGETNSSEQSTLERLDPNDLPAVTPLLARPPAVDEGRETARSGGRMSV